MEENDFGDIRAVLVGPIGSAKDSVGNAIVGGVFSLGDDTTQCERKSGHLGGRSVTLVKTPGWLRGYRLRDTPEMVKTEIRLSVSLCSPGPHAFILTHRVKLKFTEACLKSTLEHMELFGKGVWRHVMLVFTDNDSAGDSDIEGYMKCAGKPLQQLIKICGNRYYAHRDSTHSKLLENINFVIEENSGCHFEMERELLQSLLDKVRLLENKAQERLLNTQRQRQKRKNLMKGEKPELRILMLGWVYVGKSTSINTILKTVEEPTVERTNKSIKHSGEAEGRQATIVETPGWWKFFPAEFTSPTIKAEILKGISMCSPCPNALFLMFPLDTSFTEEQRKVTVDNMKLLGESAWRHCIVVFIQGDRLRDRTVEYYIESEGEAMRWLIQKCENRYHVLNNTKKEDRTQVTELLEKVEEMVVGNCNFYLNTETEQEVAHPKEGEDKNFGEDAKEINEHLTAEWDRRDWDINLISKGNRSLSNPPSMDVDVPTSLDKEESDKDEGQEHPGTLTEAELTHKWAELLEREWTRREFAMQCNLWKKCGWQDDVSEPDEYELLRSCQKVSQWLTQIWKNCNSSGYGSASSAGEQH